MSHYNMISTSNRFDVVWSVVGEREKHYIDSIVLWRETQRDIPETLYLCSAVAA